MKNKKIHTRRLAHFLLNRGNRLIKIRSDPKNKNHICYIFNFSDSCKDKLLNDIDLYIQLLSSKENLQLIENENQILNILEHMLFTKGSQITPIVTSLANNEIYYSDLVNKRKE